EASASYRSYSDSSQSTRPNTSSKASTSFANFSTYCTSSTTSTSCSQAATQVGDVHRSSNHLLSKKSGVKQACIYHRSIRCPEANLSATTCHSSYTCQQWTCAPICQGCG